MDGFKTLFAIFYTAVVVGTGSYFTAETRTMREAFDRGLAVQCVGERGYHWECAE